MRVLVIIPAYDEGRNIAGVIADLRDGLPEADLLVVDDCSHDYTARIVRSFGVTCISHPFNMGYAAALQTGFKYAVQKDYDHIVQFDGDGQHIAAVARELYGIALDRSADVVIGSRFITDTGYVDSFFRRLGSQFFCGLIQFFCHKKIYDPTSGLQVITRRFYTMLARMNYYPEYPDANLLIELIRAGALVEEVPARMRLRTEGRSMHSGLINPIVYMFLTCYSILIVLLRTRKGSIGGYP